MGGYLANFSVYTFAMIGLLFLAVFIYKKTGLNGGLTKKRGTMEIEDSLALSPRKRLHVVNVNGEKFLIAADVERTEFLAKLDSKETLTTNNVISLNKQPQLISSGDSKITSLVEKIQNKMQTSSLTQGNVALKNKVEYKPSRLSEVKTVNMKKPPMMREILRKLEV